MRKLIYSLHLKQFETFEIKNIEIIVLSLYIGHKGHNYSMEKCIFLPGHVGHRVRLPPRRLHGTLGGRQASLGGPRLQVRFRICCVCLYVVCHDTMYNYYDPGWSRLQVRFSVCCVI